MKINYDQSSCYQSEIKICAPCSIPLYGPWRTPGPIFWIHCQCYGKRPQTSTCKNNLKINFSSTAAYPTTSGAFLIQEMWFKELFVYFLFLSCLMKGFPPHILHSPSLTDCLRCGAEHTGSWQQQPTLSSPLEGGLSHNKATEELQLRYPYLFIFPGW